MGHGLLPVKTRKPRFTGAFGMTHDVSLLFLADVGCDSFSLSAFSFQFLKKTEKCLRKIGCR
jgi:hypothetical protein